MKFARVMSQHDEKRHRREAPVNRLSGRVRFLKPFRAFSHSLLQSLTSADRVVAIWIFSRGRTFSPIFYVHLNNG